MQPHRDADGQSVDLDIRAYGHHSAASTNAFGRGRSGSLLVRQFRDEAADSGSVQRDGDAVGSDIDPLDQQPQDARLLSGVKLVADRLESAEVEQILTPALARQSMAVPATLAYVGPLLACGRPAGAILGWRSLVRGAVAA